MPRGDIIAKQLWGDTIAELPHYPNLLRCARTKGSTYCIVRLRALSLSCLVSPGICKPSLRAPVRNAG